MKNFKKKFLIGLIAVNIVGVGVGAYAKVLGDYYTDHVSLGVRYFTEKNGGRELTFYGDYLVFEPSEYTTLELNCSYDGNDVYVLSKNYYWGRFVSYTQFVDAWDSVYTIV